MSELDLLLKRRKREESSKDKPEGGAQTQESGLNTQAPSKSSLERRTETVQLQSNVTQSEPVKSLESETKSPEGGMSTLQAIERTEGPEGKVEPANSLPQNTLGHDTQERGGKTVDRGEAIRIMERFADRDPKIGVWSYPAFLLLQYLYNTVPGFKMSRVAKDALERGLREMYPELYEIAEEVSRKIYEKKGITPPR